MRSDLWTVIWFRWGHESEAEGNQTMSSQNIALWYKAIMPKAIKKELMQEKFPLFYLKAGYRPLCLLSLLTAGWLRCRVWWPRPCLQSAAASPRPPPPAALQPPLPPVSPPPRTSCMIRLQSSMSKYIPSCGVLGHTFLEFVKGSVDYCQAHHDLCADKWTVEIHYYSTKKPR